MDTESTRHRRGERGSAMVIAVLLTAILTLLGISFLLMAETENRIAENELLSAQALYVSEAGAWMVKRWFDYPMAAHNLSNPNLGVIDRTLRLVNDDGDPTTPPDPQDGGTWPRYKQGVDLNGDGNDDVFDRPYRDRLVDTLLGTEDGPDMRIDENASGAASTFLKSLSSKLIGDFPAKDRGVEARISRIDVYEPPSINVAGAWVRYGIGTIKVVARIYKVEGATERVIAERMVKAVLNQIPYSSGPFGPLHSCDSLTWSGDLSIYWGAVSAVSASRLTQDHEKIASSWPREIPPGQQMDVLWGWDDAAAFSTYKTELQSNGDALEDPWLRYLSGGAIVGAPAGPQPYPFVWDYTVPDPLGAGTWPNHDHGSEDGTHANLFQNMAVVACPEVDYDLWKTIATSRGRDVHYYVWSGGSKFRESGTGPARTFRAIADGAEGLFFFDTTDGIAPYDNDADGEFDNLTPQISIRGGTWGVRGFVFLNAESFQAEGVVGRPATFSAPGEPFRDEDQDGQFDPGEDWVNLSYPNTLGGSFDVDSSDTLQDDGAFIGAPVRNSRGPEIVGAAALWGILYNSGHFEATGSAIYYGSVICKSGVVENSPAAGTPVVYWDEGITKGWPPEGWDLPRVIITRWETGL